MPAVNFQVEESPNPQVYVTELVDLAMSFRSFRVPLERCAREVMGPSFKLNFDVGGRPTSWLPLSPATVKQKGSEAVLYRTGRLRRTVGQRNIWHIAWDTAEVTNLATANKYGWIQNFGGWSGRKHATFIPARPFLVAQWSDMDDMGVIFGEWLDDRIEAAGL